jgi:hypothetical protein
MAITALRIVAVMLVALRLVPTGTHLLEMPAKMAMDKTSYFAVQHIYNGWALFGVAEAAAIVATLALAWAERRRPLQMWFAVASAALIAVSLIVFFLLTYPENVATGAPEDWAPLQRNWESGHAIEALLTFFAVTVAAVRDS